MVSKRFQEEEEEDEEDEEENEEGTESQDEANSSESDFEQKKPRRKIKKAVKKQSDVLGKRKRGSFLASDDDTDMWKSKSQPIPTTKKKAQSEKPPKKRSRLSKGQSEKPKENTVVLEDDEIVAGGVEDAGPLVKEATDLKNEIENGHIVNMKAPVQYFTEPKVARVRDIDRDYENALYRQFLLNPQNHFHRSAFIINICRNDQWKPPDAEAEEMVDKMEEEFKIVLTLARENTETNSTINTPDIIQRMGNLFANKYFRFRFLMEVAGGNHSRTCYQRLITELETEVPELKQMLSTLPHKPYTGVTVKTKDGKEIKHCVESVLFFSLSKIIF